MFLNIFENMLTKVPCFKCEHWKLYCQFKHKIYQMYCITLLVWCTRSIYIVHRDAPAHSHTHMCIVFRSVKGLLLKMWTRFNCLVFTTLKTKLEKTSM